eukprot:941333-Amphidinium_carterae.1
MSTPGKQVVVKAQIQQSAALPLYEGRAASCQRKAPFINMTTGCMPPVPVNVGHLMICNVFSKQGAIAPKIELTELLYQILSGKATLMEVDDISLAASCLET